MARPILHSSPHTLLASLQAGSLARLAENVGQELAIPPKLGNKWTVEKLKMILVNNHVASGPNAGHFRTFGAIQWECGLYTGRGRPKALYYPFNMDVHRFQRKNPKVHPKLYYITCLLTYTERIAPVLLLHF